MDQKRSLYSFWPPISDGYGDIGRLLISCPDRPGIVAAVSRFLRARGQHHRFRSTLDRSDRRDLLYAGGVSAFGAGAARPGVGAGLLQIAAPFDMAWRLAYAGRVKRLAIFVSKAEHALFELLWHRRAGDLRAEIAMVLSNHPDLEQTVATWGFRFIMSRSIKAGKRRRSGSSLP